MVQRIRSPLGQAGYGLSQGAAHLLLLDAGEARLSAGEGGAEGTTAPRLLWLPAGLRRELLIGAGSRGTLLTLPQAALTGALPATPLGDQMRRTLGQPMSLAGEAGRVLLPLIDGLEEERRTAGPGADLAEVQYVGLILLHLWRGARADLVAHGRAPQGLAERFVILAGQHLREHWKIGDYAAALGVTRDRLGSAVRRATELSPQGYLHRALTREACALLADTGMPVAQVAFRLGYGDPGYFNRFFTRQVGQSPARFRKLAKARRARGDESYAAWP
ncbi:helix-turn-helix transcriptional regulator [Pseudooceanicola nanhaiensis]|uniref:helix-turn-helix transcriptional regulator n=1 Tax=Pseudooceanicola nanhaiensis TaxID=375761 RepID=UPI001CD31398|nr:AraC family transcriptional regulator [Pseudooceanicola nanhaiensis]MCA0921825.1 AraC family transcriptional regulator [Pseudooceanicola nanhaiensis]